MSPVAGLVGLGSDHSVPVGQCVELELGYIASEEFVETLKDIQHVDIASVGCTNLAGPERVRVWEGHSHVDEDMDYGERWVACRVEESSFGETTATARGGGVVVAQGPQNCIGG